MPHQTVGDTTLYYEVHGSGPPLLLLHGLGSSTRDWALQLPDWTPHFRCILVDARGHGRSAKRPVPTGVPQLAGDIAALLRVLDVRAVHIVGLSMGGMIGCQLALDQPGLVRSVVVVNSGPALVARTAADRVALWQRLAISRLLGMRRMGRFLAGRLLPRPDQAELRQLFEERWAENDRTAYLATLRSLVGWDVTDRLAALTCPVLVVAAEHDYTPVAAKAAFTARLPRAELVVVADSRHATPIDQPQTFNRIVSGFLARVSADTPPDQGESHA